MLEIIAAMAVATASPPPVSTAPETLDGLQIIQFRKMPRFLPRDELKAERIAREAQCKYPKDGYQWINARIEVALSFTKDGSVKDVVPLASGCPELEKFVIDHFKKNGKKVAPSYAANGKWYRSAMTFRWPE